MIEVDWTYLVAIPLSVSLLILLVFSALYTIQERRRVVLHPVSRIYKCAKCQHVYVDSRDVPMARCTRCATMNEAVRR